MIGTIINQGPGSDIRGDIVAGDRGAGAADAGFGEVEKEAMIRCEYCMPDEDDLPVYVCRDPRASLQELWPQVKHYD